MTRASASSTDRDGAIWSPTTTVDTMVHDPEVHPRTLGRVDDAHDQRERPGRGVAECVVGLGRGVEDTTRRRLDQSKVAAVAWTLGSFTRRSGRSSGIGEEARRVLAQRVDATGDPVLGLGCVVDDTDACVHEVVRVRTTGAGRVVRAEILHERDVTAVLGEAAVREPTT